MHRRGMTLVELMVAMSIFITVMVLGIGGFVTISRSRILAGNMKDSQQKLRVANEMIVRFAKQAEYVKLSSNGRSAEFYFDIDHAISSANKFELVDMGNGKFDLIYSECNSATYNRCTSGIWDKNKASLIGSQGGSIYISDSNVFGLTGVLPTVLEVKLVVNNDVVGYESLSDAMTVENAIILENLR